MNTPQTHLILLSSTHSVSAGIGPQASKGMICAFNFSGLDIFKSLFLPVCLFFVWRISRGA